MYIPPVERVEPSPLSPVSSSVTILSQAPTQKKYSYVEDCASSKNMIKTVEWDERKEMDAEFYSRRIYLELGTPDKLDLLQFLFHANERK